jgi:hypothetical protein
MPITGGCRCSAVRYSLNTDTPPMVYACHCLDCQTWSGSAFTENFLVPREVLEINGPLVNWETTSPSGARSIQQFCGKCHARLFNTTSHVPRMVVMRAGTLDQSDQLTLVAHIWVSRKQPWVTIPDGIPTWLKTPPPEEFAAALSGTAR